MDWILAWLPSEEIKRPPARTSTVGGRSHEVSHIVKAARPTAIAPINSSFLFLVKTEVLQV